jgi:signal transduction histidine kinase
MDITDRKRAEIELRALSERLINAQEQERARIGRELHDDLCQQIAGISMSLGSIRRSVSGPKSQVFQQFDGVREQLSKLSQHVRELSHELHPVVLDYCDVATALQSHCKEFSSSTGIRTDFLANGEFNDVSPAVAMCLYRVTQEALQNVAKHAKAPVATVRLERSEQMVKLTVADKGRGFRPEQSARSGGLGLVSIKERVRLVKGTFALDSKPHVGTRLKIEVPLMDRRADPDRVRQTNQVASDT